SRLVIFNAQNGKELRDYPLTLPPGDLSGDPPGQVVPVTSPAGGTESYWYTGSSTIALSTTDLHPQFTVPNTLGAGVVFAGQYLVPVPDAIQVLDPASGNKIGQI